MFDEHIINQYRRSDTRSAGGAIASHYVYEGVGATMASVSPLPSL